MQLLKSNQILNLIVCLFSAILFSGCKGAEGGFAPSTTLPLVIGPSQLSAGLKSGSEIKTSNGWTLQLDTTDSIKNITTPNSWKIEVKYE